MNESMEFSNATMPVLHVMNDINTIEFGGLDLQPEYQRGFIWKNEFKDKLIYSLIKKYPTGNISIRMLETPNKKGAKSEVVDGQQRLTTIKDFITNNYTIRSEWSRRIIDLIVNYLGEDFKDQKFAKLKKKLKNSGIIKLKYNDLPNIIQGNINAYNIPVSYIAKANDLQIREYFRFLQNQERLRAGEIIKSMPATNLEIYLNSINDKEKLMDLIGFRDNRAEFDKVFYSVIGLLDEKINFGVSDKKIQDYAWNASNPSWGLENINNMISQLNLICNLDKIAVESSRKRYLKFLFLLCAFKFVDFNNDARNKLKNLKFIDDKLAVFFSAKLDAVETEFKDYNKEIIEHFRNIALITKGAHPLERVKNRMEILSFYINNNVSKTDVCTVQLIN